MKRPFISDLSVMIGAMLLAVFIFLAGAHVLNPDTQDRWKAERLQKRLTPPTGRVVAETGPEGWSSPQYSWEIEAELAWPAYCQWVSERLAPDFHIVARTDSSIEFARQSQRDALCLAPLPHSSALRVRITLKNRVYP